MKTRLKTINIGLAGCIAMFAASSVFAGDDLDTCRAGYKMLLMTPAECKHYLGQIKAAQARSDHMTVLDLQEWHTQLLFDRSQACPCHNQRATMRSLRTTSNTLSQSANSNRY